MINMKLLNISDVLTAIQNEVSPRAYKVILNYIENAALSRDNSLLTKNNIISQALLSMDDEEADYLFTRLKEMADSVQESIDETIREHIRNQKSA
tara:strand:- start:26 stop:310 length:285 start_codon:yes stop_codon:yes gene_type:complete